MNKPPATPPQSTSRHIIQLGGPMPWFSMSLELHSEDLVPDEVTTLLGAIPTETQQKGKPWVTPNGRHVRIGKFGRWSLRIEPTETNERDIAKAAAILLSCVPADPVVWNALASQAQIRLSVGLRLESFNQGIMFDADLLRLLADRKIRLDLDVYAGGDEVLI